MDWKFIGRWYDKVKPLKTDEEYILQGMQYKNAKPLMQEIISQTTPELQARLLEFGKEQRIETNSIWGLFVLVWVLIFAVSWVQASL